MKKNVTRLLSVLLSAVMLLGLCACGGKEDSQKTHSKFGKYEVDYMGASLMETESGIDALVMTYSFTNNSDSAASYGWTVFEKAIQDGAELERTFIITDPETFASVSDDYFTEVQPGESLVLSSAYEPTGTGKVTVTLSDLLDRNTYTITIDPTTLSKEDASSSAVSSGLDALINKAGNNLTDTAETESPANKPAFLEWWDGDWYGLWIITSGTDYHDGYDGYFWDCCVTIETEADLTGCLTLWDEDNEIGYSDPDVRVEVSFNSAGVGAHGTMFSEIGDFYGASVGHADWIVDPGLEKVDDFLWIDGTYEDADGSFNYEIYLRPWGVLWDDITDDVIDYSNPLPGLYDWYAKLVNAGQPMPEILDSSLNTFTINLTTPEPSAP